MKLRAFCLVVIASVFSIGSASAAVLTVSGNGQLTGATGVDVGGTFYDVRFEDGTCAVLFEGCDDAGDFLFDELTAEVAAQALLD